MPIQENKPDGEIEEWTRRTLAGEKRALARLITLVENRLPQASQVMRILTPHTRLYGLNIIAHTGRAHVIGITGAPGSGKSTLTNELIKEFRRKGLSVGVVAVDPTSTLTGGAVLGDRIRMLENYQDPQVFIRSMATRGQLGGLASMTNDVVRVMDASGKNIIILETVGVGQDEVDVARAAHTTILVEVPGMGDDIQAIKAGILEIADLLVINKSDREGVDRLNLYLKSMLSLSPKKAWRVPIIKTIASTGSGISNLVEHVERHLAYLKKSGEYEHRERARLKDELLGRVREEISRRVLNRKDQPGGLEDILNRLEGRDLDIREGSRLLLKDASF